MAKDILAAQKRSSETRPALNKLMEAEKLAPVTFTAASVRVPACAPQNEKGASR
jgi:hypothetical protein